MIYLLLIPLLFLIELVYFRLADRHNIIDKPNHRSSHSRKTIRGGGIIFPLAIIIWFIFSGFQYPWFTAGLFLISLVSFLDDLNNISRRLRLFAHLTAVALAFSQLEIFAANPWMLIPVFILFIGIINAYNFMDGINGINGR